MAGGGWPFAVAWVVLAAGIAVATVKSGLLLRKWDPPLNLLLTLPDNILRLALVGVSLALGVWLGPGPAALGWLPRSLPADLLWGALAGVVLSIALALSGLLVVRVWGEGVYSSRTLLAILPANRREWFGVVPLLLLAAAVEELLFRSLPLGGLAWLVPPGLLVWPLAVLFGFLHWPQGWWGVIGTAAGGVVFSLLFLASGNIWTPLAAHYVMNLSQLLLAWAAGARSPRSK